MSDQDLEFDVSLIENQPLSPKIGYEFLLNQLRYLIVPKQRRRY